MTEQAPGSFLKRLFCLGGRELREHNDPSEWVTSHSQQQHLGELSAKARALDVVDSDVDYHYHGLKLQQPVIDPSSMKRVHRAQLPGREAERLVETLGKIAAIAKSRQEYAHGLEQATEQLRKLEFAKERAESMAVARGAALLKCQEALSDAEEQQVQLGGMLRSALEQLGVGDIGDIGRRDWMGGAGALMSTPDHANHSHGSHHAHHAHHSSMRFRYSNVTPPSRRQRPASSFKDTPMTGFTVYSNPVSEATEHDNFATPARTNTYYSDEEEGQRDGWGGSGARSRESRLDTRASIGAETAQKLAREVLPHLGSSEIAYLVEYNLKEKEKERDRARGATDPRREPVWTNGTHAETNAATRNIKTKTSTFHIGGGPHADGDFVIRAGVDLSNGNGGIDAIGAIDQRAGYDGIPSVERRRNAAARIVAKLNERLPRELHISSLTGMDE